MSEFDFDNNDADRLRAYSLKALRTKVQEAETRKQLLFYRKDENSQIIVNPLIKRELKFCLQSDFVPEVIAEFIYQGIEFSRRELKVTQIPQKQKEAEIQELVMYIEDIVE